MVLPGLIAAFRSLAFEAPARSVLVDGSEAISATPSTMLLAYDSHGIAGPPTCRDSSGAPKHMSMGSVAASSQNLLNLTSRVYQEPGSAAGG